MIEKPRKIPLKLQKLEALLRRLPSNHPKRKEIEDEHAKTAAGYHGEKSLDYYLHFLPDNEYLILNDLRLPHKNHFFQIDTLLLSTRFHLIIEVKNFSGTLYFDPTFQQMIRISNETEEAFPDPILQVKLQRHQLFHWLNQNNCKPIPIETCVVITSPYTHLKTSAESGNQYQHVIHSANLPFTFESFEKKHQNSKISKRDLRDTADILIKQNHPYTFDALQRYHISTSEVMTGVICPDCCCLPMTKTFGKWKCSSCSASSKNAHLSALRDYSLLVNSTISNREARRFLHMGSRSAVTKLFHSMKLPYEGSYKGTRYHLSLK